MVDYGTDIEWTNNTTLNTVTGDDNTIQHIINRIQTEYTELDWIYDSYGCNYRQYLGFKSNNEALELIKNCIKQSLKEDDLIEDYDLELSYIGDGKINIILTVDGTVVEFDIGGS